MNHATEVNGSIHKYTLINTSKEVEIRTGTEETIFELWYLDEEGANKGDLIVGAQNDLSVACGRHSHIEPFISKSNNSANVSMREMNHATEVNGSIHKYTLINTSKEVEIRTGTEETIFELWYLDEEGANKGDLIVGAQNDLSVACGRHSRCLICRGDHDIE